MSEYRGGEGGNGPPYPTVHTYIHTYRAKIIPTHMLSHAHAHDHPCTHKHPHTHTEMHTHSLSHSHLHIPIPHNRTRHRQGWQANPPLCPVGSVQLSERGGGWYPFVRLLVRQQQEFLIPTLIMALFCIEQAGNRGKGGRAHVPRYIHT